MSHRFIKIGAVLLLLGVLLGLVMHHRQDRLLVPVHAHVTLAGGVLMILFGLVYKTFRAVDQSPLAAWHFWLYVIPSVALTLFTSASALMGRVFDDSQPHLTVPFTGLALMLLASFVVFALNVFRNVGKQPPIAEP